MQSFPYEAGGRVNANPGKATSDLPGFDAEHYGLTNGTTRMKKNKLDARLDIAYTHFIVLPSQR